MMMNSNLIPEDDSPRYVVISIWVILNLIPHTKLSRSKTHIIQAHIALYIQLLFDNT